MLIENLGILFLILNSAVVDQELDEIDSRIHRLAPKIKAISHGKVDEIVVSSSLEIEAQKDGSFSFYIQWFRENRPIL